MPILFNHEWPRGPFLGNFLGDHDKPIDPNSLSHLEEEFVQQYVVPAVDFEQGLSAADRIRKVQFAFLTHEQVYQAATVMAEGDFGQWLEKKLLTESSCNHVQDPSSPHQSNAMQFPPNVVGVSLLHSGQVLPAAAITQVARQLWPGALVVWGGPHISGLGKLALRQDLQQRMFAADVFVTGHAEETFIQTLEQVDVMKGATKSSPVVLAGKSKVIPPTFENLHLYDTPLTLPAQSTLGCAYGRCAFCTYPAIEDTPQKLDLFSTVGTVVDRAQMIPGSSVSLKDSLATSTRLSEIAGCIQGRVPWSACTKLSRRLDYNRLAELHSNGLATLEVGLESLLLETQRRIDKVQSFELYEEFVRNVARLDGLSMVVNYMVGFPWEDPEESREKLDEARHVLDRLESQRGCIELNSFELDRMATMAKFPEAYGINPRTIRAWPWASVLEFGANVGLESG